MLKNLMDNVLNHYLNEYTAKNPIHNELNCN